MTKDPIQFLIEAEEEKLLKRMNGQKMTQMQDKPKYIVKVRRNWRYGPRARFWDIQRWHEDDRLAEGGWWVNACKGGLAYTEWGMWRAINKRLKKMQFGSHENYFTLDKKEVSGLF